MTHPDNPVSFASVTQGSIERSRIEELTAVLEFYACHSTWQKCQRTFKTRAKEDQGRLARQALGKE